MRSFSRPSLMSPFSFFYVALVLPYLWIFIFLFPPLFAFEEKGAGERGHKGEGVCPPQKECAKKNAKKKNNNHLSLHRSCLKLLSHTSQETRANSTFSTTHTRTHIQQQQQQHVAFTVHTSFSAFSRSRFAEHYPHPAPPEPPILICSIGCSECNQPEASVAWSCLTSKVKKNWGENERKSNNNKKSKQPPPARLGRGMGARG